MNEVITDDLLAHFVVEATWADLAPRIRERLLPLAGYNVQPVLYLAGGSYRRPGDTFERFGEVARALTAMA